MTDSLKVNENALTPAGYFEILKTNLKANSKKKLEGQMLTLAENILKAKKVGQKSFLHKLSFTYDVIKKEQELLALGYDTYLLRQDVLKFIDEVKPANSVKIIELERYPRAIPTKVMDNLQKVKDLEIFDDFMIVFTDFTDENYQSKSDKEFIAKNRDPVLFGVFEHKDSGIVHDRLYFIDDWVDDYCELDFAAMVEKMTDMGIKRPERKIGTDADYLNDVTAIVKETLETMKAKPNRWEVPEVPNADEKKDGHIRKMLLAMKRFNLFAKHNAKS